MIVFGTPANANVGVISAEHGWVEFGDYEDGVLGGAGAEVNRPSHNKVDVIVLPARTDNTQTRSYVYTPQLDRKRK